MPKKQDEIGYRERMLQARKDTEFMPEVEGTILEDSPWAARFTVWVVCALLLVAFGLGLPHAIVEIDGLLIHCSSLFL